MSTTAQTLITDALAILNVYQPGEFIAAADEQLAFRILNRMMSTWAQQRLTIPAIVRQTFPIVAGKGTPANPYTIGLGGNLNVARPPNQSSVAGAGLILNASTPPVEIPRAVLTDDDYRAIASKELTNSLLTSVYYNPTFVTTGFGAIYLWPVPDNTLNTLVLYLQQALTSFATLTAIYQIPDSYDEAMLYNLTRRLAKPFGQTVDGDVAQLATNSLSLLKRSNVKMSDMPNDFTCDLSGGYNILTGTGG